MRVRVFVIGANGYLGSAIARRLAKTGNVVAGLVRDPARAEALGAAGVNLVRGDIADPDSYAPALHSADVVVQVATGSDAEKLDRQVLEALDAVARAPSEGKAGHLRRVLYTSGVWNYGDTGEKVIDEHSSQNPLAICKWRPEHEVMALDLVRHRVEVVVFQPGDVYGESRGILGSFFAMARDRHEVRWPGDGRQHWPLVHRDDAAEAYRLAAERPLPRTSGRPGQREARGHRYVLTDGSDLTARQIIEAIAKATGVPAREWPRDQVLAELGEYGAALMAGQRCVATRARRELGWTPKRTSFVAEVEAIHHEWLSGQGVGV